MTWEPISRERLVEMLAEGLAEADDITVVAWRRISIEPEKWRCSPYGDRGGGFWVVAVEGASVVWFNDIEGGFNISRFSSRGTIDEYWCNQDDFGVVLRNLPEGRFAEHFAEMRSDADVPVGARGPGRIVRRQTTYWDFAPRSGPGWRVHFTGACERLFADAEYSTLAVHDQHPLLVEYESPWGSLYVARVPPQLDERALADVLREVDEGVRAGSRGWRSLSAYLNDYAKPRGGVLALGFGLLLRAPLEIVEVARLACSARGIESSVIAGARGESSVRALVTDRRTAIVATAFRFQQL